MEANFEACLRLFLYNVCKLIFVSCVIISYDEFRSNAMLPLRRRNVKMSLRLIGLKAAFCVENLRRPIFAHARKYCSNKYVIKH